MGHWISLWSVYKVANDHEGMLLSNTICGLRTPFPIKAHLTFEANSGWPIKCPVKKPPWEYPIIPNRSLSKSEFYSNALFMISIQS